MRGKIEKDIVLAGGGHAHVQVVKRFGMKPAPGVRMTLISPDPHTPYSGMLPGLIAGHNTYDEAHIDLNALCRWAGVRFFMDEICEIDAPAKAVTFARRPPLRYDVLSLDTGSTPRADDVPGAAEHAIPVKPIARFLAHWQALLERARGHAGILRVAIVGAGAGGVELLLSAQCALEAARAKAGVFARVEFHLFSRGTIMPGETPMLASAFGRLLRQRRVHLHPDETIVRVEPGILRTAKGGRFEADEILWVTAAGAPTWPRAAGLAVDAGGFVAVGRALQSKSHPDIFAAGDIAAMVDDPRPKAGVFAVRQGPILADNLLARGRGDLLRAYDPQKRFLKIISTGDKSAIAARGAWTLSGEWVWRWKDWIDRQFMRGFNELPEMSAHPPLATRLRDALFPPGPDEMRCGGCGAKIGADLLGRALAGLRPVKRDDVLLGLASPDDAAALRVPAGMISLQSADSFRAMVDDPWLFGRIAANHALGDIYAMGGEPQAALAFVTLPADAADIVESDLKQMMAGAVETLNAAGAVLAGGHTAEGAELSLGFSVSGLADPDTLLRKGGLRAGDQLILVKPLGTGTLFAADMRAKARGGDVSAALACMLQSNAEAARIFRAHGVSGYTDVTGFGLAGHVLELLRASEATATISIEALPVLAGAREAMAAGIYSTLHGENARAAASMTFEGDAAQIVFDPQTAGGLLAGVSAANARACLEALRGAGYASASIIGEVGGKPDGSILLRVQN